jgi:hypothetical protein
MCGGKQKTPELPATPAPTPIPTPTTTEPVVSEDQRANKIRNLKMGIASTIKTSPGGVSGTGSDLSTSQGKKTLGGS